MKRSLTQRGFQVVKFSDVNGHECSLQQSSAILDDSAEAMDQPGFSGLWLGRDDINRMHLDRQTVNELALYMNNWLLTGKLFPDGAESQP